MSESHSTSTCNSSHVSIVECEYTIQRCGNRYPQRMRTIGSREESGHHDFWARSEFQTNWRPWQTMGYGEPEQCRYCITAPYLTSVLIPNKQRHVRTLVVLPCVKEPIQH